MQALATDQTEGLAMIHSFSLIAQVALGAALVVPAVVLTPRATPPRATDSFRAEHKEVRVELERARALIGQLPTQDPAEQRRAARQVVGVFEEHIKPHAAWEERELYPLVDRLAGGGEHRFTATMRHEHKIVGRWVDELSAEAAKPKPDFRAFARRADNLLGLIDAHFEEEEQVLLPLIDAAMTPQQFEHATHGEAAHH